MVLLLRFVGFILLFASLVGWAGENVHYTPGRGLKIHSLSLTLGGYISLSYQKRDNYEKFELEDIALLGFGRLQDRISYFFELEIDSFYISENGRSRTVKKIEVERLYVDFEFHDYLNLRIGRFITPIGLWNPTYISILKWTTSDPFTAEYFFPQFTTGFQIYGNLPRDWRYFLFAQKNKSISESYNNYVSKWIVGIEVEKELSDSFQIGANFGSFGLKRPRERLTFLGFNARYRTIQLELSGEFMYAWEKEDYLEDLSYRLSYYVQGVYRIVPKNYAVLRYGYFKDRSDRKNYRILTLGWNFRPTYNFVIKAEYQLREESKWNRFLSSISLLF